jgi:hypothetical protein
VVADNTASYQNGQLQHEVISAPGVETHVLRDNVVTYPSAMNWRRA